MLLYYPEFLELGTGTCKASANSMLREGDWSHVQYTTDVIPDVISIASLILL